MITLDNTAILILTCNDFEALEITLDRVLRTAPAEVPIYLLSNCAGLPGAEICENMSRIASRAQYDRVKWLNPDKRQHAYFGIRDAIANEIDAEYILKLDDDVFPINEGWLEAMVECYARQEPENLAYVSAMINNNPYGFSRLVRLPELAESYAKAMPGRHVAGEFVPNYQDFRIAEPGAVDPGGWGTVWQFPQLARWIHKETTLQPERYTALVAGLGEEEFDPSIRFSINVMLFQRDLWARFGDGSQDDEEMLNKYCAANDLRIVIMENIPFVHLYFGPQKQYLTDLLPRVREVFGPLDAVAGEALVEDWQAFKRNWELELLKKKVEE